ncbi:MAG: GAP family protein [Gammaproteobacteria bacterium]|nr:GAP family protein [Gammaproteobacteria bacterium]
MIELLPKLIPLLIFDALNPVLFALMLVAVGTNRPIANSVALLAVHTLSYFVSGVIIALGLDQIINRLNNPLPVDFVIQLLIGLLCLWAAWVSRNGKASEGKKPDSNLRPAYCFGFGAIVNFTGIPFALPYFAAVNQILKANLPVESSLLVLAFYNIAYALPFLLIPIMVTLMGDTSKPILEKINNVLVKLVDKFMPILLFVLGASLTTDALVYLITGEALW